MSNDQTNPDSFLTVRDVARRLKLDVRTVWRRIANGELKAKHFGRSVRISERDLQEYIKRS